MARLGLALLDGWIAGWMDSLMDGVDRWMVWFGLMDGWMAWFGLMDGWMAWHDGWMDGSLGIPGILGSPDRAGEGW